MGTAVSKPKSGSRKKAKSQVSRGIVNVRSTFNNTIVTITDEHGNPLAQSSAGACGNKGSRKGTPYAAGMAARDAGNKVKERGLLSIIIKLVGPGAGKDSVVRMLYEMGFEITALIEKTRVPHNGCRPPKRRRV